MAVPSILFHNCVKIPLIGLGTLGWGQDPAAAGKAVETAIDAGYTHIDTAFNYQNEKEVGAAIRKKIDEGKVKRKDIFLTTKLHTQFARRADVKECLQKSLKNLGLDYVDLYLIHAPINIKKVEGNLFPIGPDGHILIDEEVIDPWETWQGMEDVYNAGLTKAIGLSNFNHKQVQRIYDLSSVKPMNLQVECHPYFPQHELRDFTKRLNITMTAWSPLGAPWRAAGNTPFSGKNVPNIMEDGQIKAIAKKYNKSPAQVVLRWLSQREIIAIPKSTNPERIKQNISIFDFTLTDDEMKKLGNLGVNESGFRTEEGAFKFPKDHPHNPWVEPY